MLNESSSAIGKEKSSISKSSTNNEPLEKTVASVVGDIVRKEKQGRMALEWEESYATAR